MKYFLRRLIKKLLHFYLPSDRGSRLLFENVTETQASRMKYLLLGLQEKGLSCQSILDIGAHRGYWSELAKRYFPQAAFVLVEAQKEMEGALCSFCKSTPGSHYVLKALGAKSELRTMTVWDEYAATLVQNEADSLYHSDKQREVEVVTVDQLLESLDVELPQIVKIDVQGYELEVLRGADVLFGSTEVFIIEVSVKSSMGEQQRPELYDIVHFMYQKRYVVYGFPGFLTRPIDGIIAECDLCFVKKDGFLRTIHRWARED